MQSQAQQSQWWRLPRVIAETGLSRPTIYRHMAKGEFPSNHAIRGFRAKVWLEAEVRAWKGSALVGIGDLL